MKKYTYLFLLGVILAACSPKLTSNLITNYRPLPRNAEVLVVEQEYAVSDSAILLGRIAECDLILAREQARKAGGNLLRLTGEKIEVLRIEDNEFNTIREMLSVPAPHPDYGVIYLYRNAEDAGPVVNYDVHIGDTSVYRSSVNSYAEVKIEEEGEYEIWAKTEAKEVLPLSVSNGGDYYVRSGVSMGFMIGQPKLELVSPEQGRIEYWDVKSRVTSRIKPVKSDSQQNLSAPQWRISLQGGYSYRLGETASVNWMLQDYMEKLRHGFFYGADVTGYFMESMGAGVKFSGFGTKVSQEVTVEYDGGRQESALLSDNISIRYFGPMLSYRLISRDFRNSLIINTGVGYLGYTDKVVFIDPYTIKGSAVGYLLELGYDFRISDKVSLGLLVSSVSGVMKKYRTDASGVWRTVILEEYQRESLSHLDFSFGVRINL